MDLIKISTPCNVLEFQLGNSKNKNHIKCTRSWLHPNHHNPFEECEQLGIKKMKNILIIQDILYDVAHCNWFSITRET